MTPEQKILRYSRSVENDATSFVLRKYLRMRQGENFIKIRMNVLN